MNTGRWLLQQQVSLAKAQRDAAEKKLDALRTAIAALHEVDEGGRLCSECQWRFPCPTRRLLVDAEERKRGEPA